MGFMVSVLSLCTVESLRACMIYLVIYVITSINIFAIILAFRKIGSFAKIRHLVEFSTMLKANYLLAIIFSLVLLSLAGIPPLAGFLVNFMFFLHFWPQLLLHYSLFGFIKHFKCCLLY